MFNKIIIFLFSAIILTSTLFANDKKIIVHLVYQNNQLSVKEVFSEENRHNNLFSVNEGKYEYILKSAAGITLSSGYFNLPEYIYYDSFDSSGIVGGRLNCSYYEYFLEVPFYSEIAELKIETENKTLLSFMLNPNNLSYSTKTFFNSSLSYPFEKIFGDGDPKNRINLVFLGDGYTGINETFVDSNNNGKRDGDDFLDLNGNGVYDSSETYIDNNNNRVFDFGEKYDDINKDAIFNFREQDKYKNDVNNMIKHLFNTLIFGIYKNHFNIYRIDNLHSEQAGADHNYITPPLLRNTLLNSYYDQTTERLLVCDYSIVNNIIRSSLPELGGRYIVIVIVNSIKYGGSGGSISVSYNGSSGYEVMVHELGHTLPGLADEYDYPYNTYSGPEPFAPNITTKTKFEEIKWNKWIKPSTPLPTPSYYNEVGLFEGAYYYLKGIFRPILNCKMRTLNTPFCPVCNETIIKTMYNRNNMIDSYIPIADSFKIVSFPVKFELKCIEPKPNTLKYKWSINDNLFEDTGNSATFNSLPIGNVKIKVQVSDITEKNRSDTTFFEKSKVWYVYNPSTTGVHQTIDFIASPELMQNYPNPFNPVTQIEYYVPMQEKVELRVYDLLGREVATLVSGTKNSGYHKVEWNGNNLPSGIYFYRLFTQSAVLTKKMILTK